MFRNPFASLWGWLTLQQCPTEQQLAEYADQQSIAADRQRIERHLASCNRCLQQVGFLVRTAVGQAQPVPEELLRRAERLGSRRARPTKFPLGRATIATGALAAVFAIFVILNRPEPLGTAPGRQNETAAVPPPGRPEPSRKMTEHGAVRGVDSLAAQLILYPEVGQTVATNELTFRWTAVVGALFYELQVLSDDGDVIWETKSRTTSAKLPGAVQLVKGHTYFVRIRVHGSHDTVLKAQSVSFVAG